MPPPPKPITPLPQKEKTPAPRKQQSMVPVTPQRAAPQRASNLQVADSVSRLDLLAANPGATTSSSNVLASDSTRVNISKPPMPRFMAPSNAQPMSRTSTTQRKVTPLGKSEVVSNSHPSDSTEAFQKDWSSPLHSKPAQLKIGPPVNTSCSGASTRASSRVLVVNDDEEGQIQEDLVTGGAALFEDDGLADNFSNFDDNKPNAPQDEPMDLDRDESPSGDKEPSPPPMNIARRLHQAPRISFIFDKATGDFIEPHPTIFIPRPTAPPVPSQDLRHSARSQGSPFNPDAAYLKAVQGSKVDTTKKRKKKDVKGKGHTTETKAPHKRARPKDDTSQVKDKLASKKPKLKETVIIDGDEHMAQDFQGRRQLL
ncbi:hypothetical protein ARMGADRAFT_1036498 [Armillaria gallica]|uniref:Uncharacterized protein n=1 Tax=Armillaria gallica TaxID=47427 RepID=A0A2H3DAA5_ARMGA|nr:hypothetical protein ARMGADRAFT_1036498 [Armillaria gallica]